MSEASNRRTHGDSKSVIIGRGILAFFLFLCITAVSVLACVRIVMINPENIARIFTDEKYVCSGVCLRFVQRMLNSDRQR